MLDGVSCAGRDEGGVFSSLGAGEDDLGVAAALEGSEPVGVRDGEEPILLNIARRFWRIFPRELASMAKAFRRAGAVIPYLFGRRQGRLWGFVGIHGGRDQWNRLVEESAVVEVG